MALRKDQWLLVGWCIVMLLILALAVSPVFMYIHWSVVPIAALLGGGWVVAGLYWIAFDMYGGSGR